MTDIRSGISKLLNDEFQIAESITAELFERGILNEYSCRNVLIKKEYQDKARPKERQRVKGKIAERYCVSIKLVEKILSKNS